jgi:hypothetical protein
MSGSPPKRPGSGQSLAIDRETGKFAWGKRNSYPEIDDADPVTAKKCRL